MDINSGKVVTLTGTETSLTKFKRLWSLYFRLETFVSPSTICKCCPVEVLAFVVEVISVWVTEVKTVVVFVMITIVVKEVVTN